MYKRQDLAKPCLLTSATWSIHYHSTFVTGAGAVRDFFPRSSQRQPPLPLHPASAHARQS